MRCLKNSIRYSVRRVFVGMGLMCAFAAHAHEPMTHRCEAPERPVDEHNDLLWQNFLDQVDQFRTCVNDKMEWHQRAAAAHQDAARQVVEAWNTFVHTSLNAPEDFPWPPES